ncbi:putative starch synthase 4, chloroplastic/amyloplastic isoform X2 [Panicum miliaceum]|uniref:starch synthase n=1 Tax=Panicum miliaceum TaxID=4540 RepID=A0A3L6QI14_PANMI|nr:putative starch synthase 4, chloroplastic/amyloplastic isoform X2 [Panicum miliaceum]
MEELKKLQDENELLLQEIEVLEMEVQDINIQTNMSSGVGLILIEPIQLSYFNRDMLRGYPDDFERGTLFWDIFAHQGLENTRILLTCQDLDSQDPNVTHLVNVLKGGIVYSNKVILMSSIHSRDVLTRGLRHGLETTLTAHKEKILVASHGLDGELWDPSKDIYLPQRYSANDIEGKSICREALKRRLGFHSGSSIIFINLDESIAFIEEYDETLAHLVYAGSDIILCSSFEDPSLQIAVSGGLLWGLQKEPLITNNKIQMKAIKYGCAPMQINFPNDKSRQSEGNDCRNRVMSKYIISTYGELSLLQALDSFKNEPSLWDQRIKDGMVKGLAWNAECYDLHWEAYSFIRKL